MTCLLFRRALPAAESFITFLYIPIDVGGGSGDDVGDDGGGGDNNGRGCGGGGGWSGGNVMSVVAV